MAAIKKVQVSTRWNGGFQVECKSRDLTYYVDQPKEGGGENKGPTPLEYLFASLASCLTTIGLIVMREQKLNIRNLEVDVQGELDLEVLMAKKKNFRAGFYDIVATVKIDGDLSEEEKHRFLEEVDARCPISDNLMNLTPVIVKLG